MNRAERVYGAEKEKRRKALRITPLLLHSLATILSGHQPLRAGRVDAYLLISRRKIHSPGRRGEREEGILTRYQFNPTFSVNRVFFFFFFNLSLCLVARALPPVFPRRGILVC